MTAPLFSGAVLHCYLQWFLLEPHLPGRKGVWGGVAEDNRQFINAVFWIMRTGAPWRDLPPDVNSGAKLHQKTVVQSSRMAE